MSTNIKLEELTPTEHPLSVFGIKNPKTLRGYVEQTPYTPKVDPNYIFQPEVFQFLTFFWLREKNNKACWLWGHTGTGKTSAYLQFFARLKVPCWAVSVNGNTRFEEFVGMMGIKEDGSTGFKEGPLTLAMVHGGVLLIDEIDKLDPFVASGFHGVLDGNPLVLCDDGGRIVHPHPNFRIVATANTNGTGDETGLYPTSQVQDTAYMTRFIASRVKYMDPALEFKVLKKAVGNSVDQETLEKMVAYANEIREAFTSETMERGSRVRITMEARTIIDWAEMTHQVQGVARMGKSPLEYALNAVLLDKASSGDREKLEEWYQRVFGSSAGVPSSDDQEGD